MSIKYKKPLWFYDDLYKMNYYLICPATPEILTDFVKKQFDLEYEKPYLGAGCCTEICDNYGICGIIISLQKFNYSPERISALVHECLHAVDYVFSQARVFWYNDVDSNNEHFTYYLEYLVKNFLELIKKDREEDRKKVSKTKTRSKK